MEAEKNSENLTELERRWSGFKQVNAAFLNMLVKNRSTDYIEVGKSAVSVVFWAKFPGPCICQLPTAFIAKPPAKFGKWQNN